jgi:ABC-2 type transport system ATP-binding protein
MVQRVGLAQAILNEPELVILDEPMSGLDPLGRRDVRRIVLELRDEGRTVLFSSHILSDAETLCSRVGILVRGRLVTAGAVSDLTAEGTHGWEVVATGLPPELVGRLQPRVRRLTTIATGRYAIEIGASERPEALVAELSASGAALLSVTPLGRSLEDVFVRSVREGTP